MKLFNYLLLLVSSTAKFLIFILFFFIILFATKTNAQVQIIGPNAGSLGNTPEAERARKASANIKTAILFLKAWGLNNEADNIQQWFNDRYIYLDMDLTGAETSTTSGAITIDCFLALGGSKGSSNSHHVFNPDNARDKELIAELAFTLVHEKVHAHQSYSSFILGREGNETEAYNKEITDEDEVIRKMIVELEIAKKKADKEKMKDLSEWINAVVETKIKAIYTFDNNYSRSRKKNWSDEFLEKLKKLRDENNAILKQILNNKALSEIELSEFKNIAVIIQQYENDMSALPMPAYWIKINKPAKTSYVIKSYSSELEKLTFYHKGNTYEIIHPLHKNAGDVISGTLNFVADSTKGTENKVNMSNKELIIEINDKLIPVVHKAFSYVIPADSVQKRIYLSLKHLSGNHIGNTILSFSASPTHIVKENNFRIPLFNQKNEPIKIDGFFDGSYMNTTCIMNNENAEVIAESPQQAFVLPNNKLLGDVICKITEGNRSITQQINIVDLKLEVQSTSLKKGEKTTLRISIEGFQNMKTKAFLYLYANGPISMKGGNQQIITIQSTDIHTNGTWRASFPIKATETGNFEINAEIRDSKVSN